MRGRRRRMISLSSEIARPLISKHFSHRIFPPPRHALEYRHDADYRPTASKKTPSRFAANTTAAFAFMKTYRPFSAGLSSRHARRALHALTPTRRAQAMIVSRRSRHRSRFMISTADALRALYRHLSRATRRLATRHFKAIAAMRRWMMPRRREARETPLKRGVTFGIDA